MRRRSTKLRCRLGRFETSVCHRKVLFHFLADLTYTEQIAMPRLIHLSLLLLVVTIHLVTAERIKDKIYMPVDGVAACFRKHNGTHQFGCSSSKDGSVGVIQLVETEADVRWLENNATAGPYTAVMPFSMFTRDFLLRLAATNNINGVLLAKNSSEALPSNYSAESTCPNRYSGYQTCNTDTPWNPWGMSILLEDWKFPIFYVENDKLVMKIKECYVKHNAHTLEKQFERSLCALEMQSFMSAAINSETCIRRSRNMFNMNPSRMCDPLGDRNIHWPLSQMANDAESVILVTARLDATSMFDGLAPGAHSAVTGFVTLLATAYYLNSLNATVNHTNVLFSLLNGESFDYIGSSRFVYDLKRGNFNALAGKNLKFNQIKTIIELGQLGGEELYLHANNYKSSDLIAKLQKALPLKATLADSIPPASIQSFLAVAHNLTAVVIGDHGEQFINKYYGGILDNAKTLGLDQGKLNKSLASIAINLGDVLYEKVTGLKAPSGNITLIEELVSEMLSCYLESAQCNLFQAASEVGAELPNDVYPLYVGVHTYTNHGTIRTGQLLALLTSEKMTNMTEQDCHNNRNIWIAGMNLTGVCIKSTVNYTSAISPAFIIEGYQMSSGLYSTWSESVWHMLSVRMFLKPSAATERLTLALGSTVFILSFIIVWFIDARAEILFNRGQITADC